MLIVVSVCINVLVFLGVNVPKPCPTFEHTSFPSYLLDAISAAGFQKPTPIQVRLCMQLHAQQHSLGCTHAWMHGCMDPAINLDLRMQAHHAWTHACMNACVGLLCSYKDGQLPYLVVT